MSAFIHAFGILADAPTADTAVVDSVISAQPPFPTAVTNLAPANVRLKTFAPIGAGAEGGIVGSRSGTSYLFVAPRTGNATVASRIWLGPNANAQSASNYMIECQASDTYINTVGNVHLQVGASDIVIASASLTTIGANGNAHSATFFGGASLGGGVGVMGIKNASTVPNTNPTSGGVVYETAGALTHRGSSGTITTLGPA